MTKLSWVRPTDPTAIVNSVLEIMLTCIWVLEEENGMRNKIKICCDGTRVDYFRELEHWVHFLFWMNKDLLGTELWPVQEIFDA